MLKLQNNAFTAVIADNATLKRVVGLFAEVPAVDSTGGMTLDMGNGPIVVCHGKPSLADEKALRQALRGISSKIKLSRTNNITQRVADYKIARNAKDWAKLFGADSKQKADKTDKTEPTTESTQPIVPTQADNVPTDGQPTA